MTTGKGKVLSTILSIVLYVLFVLVASFILEGIGLMASRPSPDSIMGAILGFGLIALFIILVNIASWWESANLKEFTLLAGTLYVLFVSVALFILEAYSPSPDSIKAAIVGFGFGAPIYILGVVALRKDLAISKELTLLAVKGLFSPYYVGKEGVYKEGIFTGKKLLLRWSEVADVLVIREHENFILKHLVRRTIQKRGTIRVITKDGREIDITDVINPKETVEHIKNTYLKDVS